MRNEFCRSVIAASADERFVFLTGDLGFKALEPLRDAAGERFVNAGVAEQNMVSVAAGLAKGGLRPWVYSIAPFVYARPFEQIRNDVCLHDLPVTLVGNGGGYGYGVMGSSHHAIEDYGALLTLQNLRAFVPAFRADVAPIVEKLRTFGHPAYLRLGLGEEPAGFRAPPYTAWRRLVEGDGATVLVVGPLVGPIVAAVQSLDFPRRPNLWIVTELPLGDLPAAFLEDLARSNDLLVVEEHVVEGSAGRMIAHALLLKGAPPRKFTHLTARGYLSGRYGSQTFHRKECGLDAQSVVDVLTGEKAAV